MIPDKDADQRARFIEAARELGADEDEATFKAKLGVIARQKPEPSPQKLAQKFPENRSKKRSTDSEPK